MKHLQVLRHGKSDWEAAYEFDHCRPLAKRGTTAAQSIGKIIAVADQVPNLVIASSALRTRTTAELAKESGQWECPIHISDTLYESSLGSIIAEMAKTSEKIETLMIVGHEPICSTLIQTLTAGGSIRFPTAAFASVVLNIEHWTDINRDCGDLQCLLPIKFFAKGKFKGLI